MRAAAMKEGNILLVEDNPDHATLTRRALKQGNVANSVVLAEDGQAALDFLFGAGNALPVLILLDLKLPKVDGLEVLKRLRASKRTRRIPVVILTSSDDERDRAACYDLGCNSYIRKPVDFDQFSSAVRELGLYWLVLNEQPPLPR
jgi:two-component system, response regulator